MRKRILLAGFFFYGVRLTKKVQMRYSLTVSIRRNPKKGENIW